MSLKINSFRWMKEAVDLLFCFSFPLNESAWWTKTPKVHYFGWMASWFSTSLHEYFGRSYIWNCRSKLLGGIIYTQIVNASVNQTWTLENYVKNPRGKKLRGKEGERNSTKSGRLQRIIKTLLQVSLSKVRSPFSMDLQVHKYPVAMWLMVCIFRISTTAFTRCDFLTTAQIAAPDCWDCYAGHYP